MLVNGVELRDDVFNVEPKKHILWDVVRWQLAKRRQGTHSTKTRAEVNYSKKKILPQKGTGNARHGARSANIFVGGGVAHGPKPRDYEYKLSKKYRKIALAMALSTKAKSNSIYVLESLLSSLEKPKTKAAFELLKERGLSDKKVLVVTEDQNDIVSKSFKNIPNTKVLPVVGLNVYDILWADALLIEQGALEKIYERVSL
jgi:LSU ribosomal protein L4P